MVSTSYSQDESSLTAAYAQRQCAEYGKLGLLGTTILYSSGDNGVAGNGGFCTNGGVGFNPGFPVTCGFVTAVGATQVNPGSTVKDPEGACEQVIFSGGGFSNFFELPSYQEDAVKSFLKDHPPPFTSAQFNNSGKVCDLYCFSSIPGTLTFLYRQEGSPIFLQMGKSPSLTVTSTE